MFLGKQIHARLQAPWQGIWSDGLVKNSVVSHLADSRLSLPRKGTLSWSERRQTEAPLIIRSDTMSRMISLTTLVLLGAASVATAQPNDAVRLTEDFRKDATYHVSCQVEIAGVLSVPAGKDAKP